MAATSSFLACPTLLGKKFWMDSNRRRRVGQLKTMVKARRESNESEYSGNLVDENMILLRMRIKELSMLEKKNEMSHAAAAASPLDWMEYYENKYFPHYNVDVCEAVGLLQMFLMNTRPALAVGLVLLIALSVFLSTSVLMFNAVETAKALLSGLN